MAWCPQCPVSSSHVRKKAWQDSNAGFRVCPEQALERCLLGFTACGGRVRWLCFAWEGSCPNRERCSDLAAAPEKGAVGRLECGESTGCRCHRRVLLVSPLASPSCHQRRNHHMAPEPYNPCLKKYCFRKIMCHSEIEI